MYDSIFCIKCNQQKIITMQFLCTFHHSGEFAFEGPLAAYIVRYLDKLLYMSPLTGDKIHLLIIT